MISVSTETITPELAKAYWGMNVNNPRRFRETLADTYAKDMESGKWVENGEPIIFSEDGSLLDGQHRIQGIIRSGVTLSNVVVVRGVNPEIKLFDAGATRTVAQTTGLGCGECSIAKTMVQGFQWNRGDKAPKGLVAAYALEHKEELELAVHISKTGGSNRPKCKCKPIQVAIYLMLRNKAPAEILETFFGIVNSGFPVDNIESTPAVALAKYIDNNHEYFKSYHGPDVAPHVQVALVAYVDFLQGAKRTFAYRKPQNCKQAFSLMEKIRKLDGFE